MYLSYSEIAKPVLLISAVLLLCGHMTDYNTHNI